MSASTFRRLHDERGTATLEFALVVPVLLAILLTGIDFSRALLAYTTIGNATREGVRYAALHPGATDAEVLGAVQRYAGPLNPSLFELEVKYTEGGAASAGIPSRRPRPLTVQVTVKYPWQATSAIAAGFFTATSGSPTLASSASMDTQR
ncbi:MAG: pilus assembly protein [Actinomycetota bacterium]|nr:pilus assembly protein [Actinomycetota bacterium]